MTRALARESEKVARIARNYHAWRGEQDAGAYEDVPGFCKSATLEEIRKHSHVLTLGRYVGAEAQADDGEPFEEKMKRLAAALHEQIAEARKLDVAIEARLGSKRLLGHSRGLLVRSPVAPRKRLSQL